MTSSACMPIPWTWRCYCDDVTMSPKRSEKMTSMPGFARRVLEKSGPVFIAFDLILQIHATRSNMLGPFHKKRSYKHLAITEDCPLLQRGFLQGFWTCASSNHRARGGSRDRDNDSGTTASTLYQKFKN